MRNKAPRQKGVDDREDKEGPLLPPKTRELLNYKCILKMYFKGESPIESEGSKMVVLCKLAFAWVTGSSCQAINISRS